MVLIRGGRVVDPEKGEEKQADVIIKDGRIAGIGDFADDGSYEQVINAAGLMVAPGLVDIHVHFRDPGFTHKENIRTGAAAAAAGGFTTVVCMANTKPVVDSREILEYVIEEGKKTKIHVLAAAAVSVGLKGKELTDMEELKKAGACGFTDDGIPLMDGELLRQALKQAAALDAPVSLHEEDPGLIGNNGINRGKASEYFGISGSPREAEIRLTERDLQLALETGARVCIQHISARESVELVRQAKERGGDVHAEATPHHFTLTEEAAVQYGTLAKMNPPLREEADRQEIIRGLADGTIDMIATDHAPHTAEEKARSITEAPSGVIGLETALALGITELVDKGYLSMRKLLELMSTNPAALYHLDAGYLEEGGPADIVLLDPSAEFVPAVYASRSCNTPFTGWKLKGAVRATICKGKPVYESRACGLQTDETDREEAE